MCGILGVFLSEAVSGDEVAEASKCMAGRGPDDEGYVDLETGESFYGEKFSGTDHSSGKWMAHQRLAITGGEESRQPMNHEDLWISFEGEIYNYRELRQELEDEGYRFETEGDTEVFLKAYAEWGENSLEKLRGDWAAAIYNEEEDTLTCFTDRFGTKNVYFYETGDGTIIASDIKPLFQFPSVEKQKNQEVVMDYLKYGLTDHRRETFFRGIKRLKAGEKLVVKDKGSCTIESWHEDFEKQEGDIEEAVKHSFKLRTPEKDFACTLSGGLDSTVLANYVKDRDPEFFSVTVPGSDQDEAEYISAVEEELGIETTRIEISSKDIIEEARSNIRRLEEPISIFPGQAQSILFREIENSGVDVLVQGSGSDELFCGYQKFIPVYISDLFQKGKYFEAVKQIRLYRHSLGLKEYVNMVSSVFPRAGAVLRKVFLPYPDSIFTAEHNHGFDSSKELEDAVKKHRERFWFPAILKIMEKNSAPVGLEARPAFLDSDMASTAMEDLKSNFEDGFTKKRLRDAFEDVIPEKVLSRKQKQGFLEPENSWHTPEVVRELQDTFRSNSFESRDLLESRKILRELRRGKLPFDLAYRLYVYEHWMREFFPEE